MAVTPRSSQSSAPTITEAELKKHSQELGKIGSLFGSKDNAPVYLAGIVALLSLIGAILVALFSSPFPEKGDLVKSLVAVVLSALSFIGGASGRSKE